MSRSSAFRWCYTLNNYTSVDEVLSINDHATYHIFGEEVGEEGTPHLQGYVCLKKRTTLVGMKKLLPRAHLEVARGKPSQNIEYCSKEGKTTVFGTPPEDIQGAARWSLARKAAEEGRMDDIPDDMYIRYINAFKRIRQDNPPTYAPLDHTTGIWLYGRSGVGKSRLAREIFPEAYLKPCNKWWDGYRDEEFVFIEDVDDNHRCLGHHFKIWTDHYSFPAEQKGTTIVIRPKLIIVTSQFHINEIWPDFKSRDAIQRRFAYFGVSPETVNDVRAALLEYKSADSNY